MGTFSLAALVNFDALIQFQPFMLVAELGASITLARNNTPFLHAGLYAMFSGPGPWRIVGYAEFIFLGKRRVDVEATIGEPLPAPIVRMLAADLRDDVVEAFGRADAWAALPPLDAERIVTLRDQPAGDRIRIHPLGALSARQRVLPFGKLIERFGAAEVPATTFSLEGFTIGASAAVDQPAEHLLDDFAPGQFTPLTDDEKTARPAFEAMRSGGRVAVAAFRVPASLVPAPIGYEESIVDDEPETFSRVATRRDSVAAPPASLTEAAVLALAHGGAAAQAATRIAGSAAFRGTTALAIGVKGERYVAAGADTLVGHGRRDQAAEAHDDAKTGAAASPGNRCRSRSRTRPHELHLPPLGPFRASPRRSTKDDHRGAAAGRAPMSASVSSVTGTGLAPGRATLPIDVLGPGDVAGLDHRQVVRTFPVAGTLDFEDTYCAHIELDRPDSCPGCSRRRQPAADGSLRPWMCLAVVEKRENAVTSCWHAAAEARDQQRRGG